jgi:alpha-L-fucosidase
MKTKIIGLILIYILTLACSGAEENPESDLDWWRNARFGLFIHWGLYAIPAGEWNGKTNYGEWIRNNAQIPLEEYDQFLTQFNPGKFDADQWVKYAKDAGMKYIIITSKHHDGFSLWNSEISDFDIMSTPFQRDILIELAEACNDAGIKLGFYHSIMDWHHPHYLPRRNWETERSAAGADYNQYVEYMKKQLGELLTNYGDIGVLWFDGEWEETWTHELGVDLYNYVKSFQPSIIINNRVDKGRGGMAGMTEEGYAGDFGTPEQEIPETGFPGVEWESCMTMNDNWGYNKLDNNWKSTKELIRNLTDIASKGGNFLLNVGPTAEGIFPEESVNRLKEIGAWMEINGESIYGTQASPFTGIKWGKVTCKSVNGSSTLYLHVFDWPEDGKLQLHGITNRPTSAKLLAGGGRIIAKRMEAGIEISLPAQPPDSINPVIKLSLSGTLDVINPPGIITRDYIFIEKLTVVLEMDEQFDLRYTLNGPLPTIQDPVYDSLGIIIEETTNLKVRKFNYETAMSDVTEKLFTRVQPNPSLNTLRRTPGVLLNYYEGNWDVLPDFNKLDHIEQMESQNFGVSLKLREEYFGLEFLGYVNVPERDVYYFYLSSDDGSNLYIDAKLIVENDGLHGMKEASGAVALEAGPHLIKVIFFEKTGGDDLKVEWHSSRFNKQTIADSLLFY